jgi:hypothetical protein
MIAGIDYSTRAVDVVLLDEDSDAATWHRFELEGADAFDRTRSVREAMRRQHQYLASVWDDVLAVGIEDPRGYNAGALYRIQGAILATIPQATLVHPLIPSQWRKTVGLPGNASKGAVFEFTMKHSGRAGSGIWPQDACDAYCIALATRTLLVTNPASAADTILG